MGGWLLFADPAGRDLQLRLTVQVTQRDVPSDFVRVFGWLVGHLEVLQLLITMIAQS
jgi:hypothetical protein